MGFERATVCRTWVWFLCSAVIGACHQETERIHRYLLQCIFYSRYDFNTKELLHRLAPNFTSARYASLCWFKTWSRFYPWMTPTPWKHGAVQTECRCAAVADRCEPSGWSPSGFPFRSSGVRVPTLRDGIARCCFIVILLSLRNGSRGVKHTGHVRLASSNSATFSLIPVTECGPAEGTKKNCTFAYFSSSSSGFKKVTFPCMVRYNVGQWRKLCCVFNPLNTKRRPLYLKTQFVAQ